MKALVICVGLIAGGSVLAAPAPDCVVRYEPIGLMPEFRASISSTRPKRLPAGHVEKANTPQGTGSLTVYRFDSMKAGAGSVVVALYPPHGGPRFLSFDPAIGAHAAWVNESLVYIQVWWGRIVASEMVVDASEGRILYEMLANYGSLREPECGRAEH